MRLLFLTLLCYVTLLAREQELLMLLHHENYKDNKGDVQLSSLYFSAEDRTKLFSLESVITSAINATLIDAKKSHFLYASIPKEKIVISALSLDYYFESMVVSGGRQNIDFDWLQGSFDGLLGYAIYGDFEVKLFSFLAYELLTPSYYLQYTKEKMPALHGGMFRYKDDQHWDISSYLYHQSRALSAGLSTLYHLDNHLFTVEGALYQNKLYKETLLKFAYSTSVMNSFRVEFGGLKSGKNGVSELLRYGDSRINTLKVGNLYYLPNASNLFLSLAYEDERLFLHSTVGVSHYDIEQTRSSLTQFDTSLYYYLKENIFLEMVLLVQQSQKEEEFVFVSGSLGYSF
jgi:hypothetical protein